MGFGIEGNIKGHIKIGFIVDIDMANTIQMFNHRHTSIVTDALN